MNGPIRLPDILRPVTRQDLAEAGSALHFAADHLTEYMAYVQAANPDLDLSIVTEEDVRRSIREAHEALSPHCTDEI